MERRKNAFTLIELLVVIAIIALLIGILLPALGQAKRSAANIQSLSNMKSLNTGAANYAADNSDSIFSYTWRADVKYFVFGSEGKAKSADSDAGAAGIQNMDILRRATGRTEDTGKIVRYFGRLPHRRYSHLVLLDFLTDVMPEPIAASPFDRNQLEWAEDPLGYLDTASSTVPYAGDIGDIETGYDRTASWATPYIRQRWAFASSYQVVPAAWNTDGIGGQTTYIPAEDSPHLFANNAPGGDDPKLGRRRYTQVAHPANKVHMFEEFDRFTESEGLYFAYPEAKPNLAFFDGSVRSENTSDANAGWNPETPNEEWLQTYVPLDSFPLPKDGLNDNNVKYCQRFRWTRHGLRGVDFGGKDIGRHQAGLESTPDSCVEE